ncbi:hypothetical protein Psta_0049 [Pirellula staleyi DSM 6068]|uniref:Uncharacterized protein n=1 Tax=Pirellula staleyi (strain ATCC 27377 / DSM 6068 / ICPB 4128) TaxID=530564 RepID=D2QZI8_PIRSD|nr:hypothetical protein Psta_0049 [Pirellula staleyi DSM 6068]
MSFKSILVRSIAVVLAIGGSCWGLLLGAAFWAFGPLDDPLLAFAIFGPGYLATALYFLRLATFLNLWQRRSIWIVSLLVQGAWTATLIASAIGHSDGMQGGLRHPLVAFWLIGATIASALALFLEQPDSERRAITHANE